MSEPGAGFGAGFGARAQQWAAWQDEPWGRLRYEVVAHTLTRALSGSPERLRVLDVGGGDGADSLPLARAGHDVTLLDVAGELLAVAATSAERLGVDVTTVQADLDDVERLGFRAGFDLVLCHNVVHYRDDVPATVAVLTRLLRPGGVVSVMAPNPAMDVLSAAVRRLEPRAALDLIDADTVHGVTFDHPMRRIEAEVVEEALRARGCVLEHRFGIRCVMDLIADDERKRDPRFHADLLDLELAVCERDPYRRTARFWQVTARRPVPPG